MRKIKIHSELKKQIANELKTSLQTVHTALCYFNNSDMAVEIRKRAKALLMQEANNIEETPNNE